MKGEGDDSQHLLGLVRDGAAWDKGHAVRASTELDRGMLRFWVDGKQHGPGFSSGVQGRLRWATSMHRKSGTIDIVHTPALQPWSAS
jgi:hypothetical protein